ncbi:hypothetical protein CTI14_29200 [Methylobacterium radiotolerans]|nr:hypothetical protein CTI14_29200 [Methylobacterium radiotolerans]
MKKVYAVVCVALVSAGAWTGGPAMASPEPESATETASEIFELLDTASDPEATFGALTEAQQEAFTDYYFPVDEEVAVSLTPADDAAAAAIDAGSVQSRYGSLESASAAVARASGCFGGHVRRTAYSSVNIALWDMCTEGKWCGNGKTATSASFSRSWTTIGTIGWRDAGQIGKGAGVVSGQARIWAQRKMIFGTGGWEIQTMQPCLRLNGGGGGSKSQSVVCSIY